jgi:non-ribosomal peptide synthetase component F
MVRHLAGTMTRHREAAVLPRLTASERHRVLVEWNATQGDYPSACIHQLFEAQAARAPDATAVMFENECWTYRELNQRANQLAHDLRRRGVEQEDLDGLCIERSPQM